MWLNNLVQMISSILFYGIKDKRGTWENGQVLRKQKYIRCKELTFGEKNEISRAIGRSEELMTARLGSSHLKFSTFSSIR